MILKEQEYKELLDYKNNFNEKLDSSLKISINRIKELEEEIEQLKQSKKPDHIVIDIYGQANDKGYWVKYQKVQLSKCKLHVSNGVKFQILKIIRDLLKKLNNHFDSEIKDIRERSHNYINEYYNVKKSFKKLPLITTRKKVLKILNDEELNELSKKL